MNFSVENRPKFIAKAASEHFDLLIIGGGITGAGIALDAVARGLKVCLVEKGDFASGTSSKSTKLIHGGLRYLKQFEFALVKEVGQERTLLHNLAPHIVVPEKMILPLIKGGSLGKTMTSIGLYIYDFLAEVEDLDKRRMLNKEETLAIEPLLRDQKLLGGSIYAEYRTDDARLTIEVVKSAYSRGANLINYMECTSMIEEDGKLTGARCLDHTSQKEVIIRAGTIVNATGPWVDEVRMQTHPIKGKRLYLTKGVHLVIPKSKLPIKHSIYFDVGHDKRMIFTIPRLDTTYIGTTDTYYEEDKDDIEISLADITYLLNAVNQTFDIDPISPKDIVASWAGLRPLIYEDGKSASEISRKDEIFVADNGLISIAGGKLTGYRKMAERVVDRVLLEDTLLQGTHCTTDEIYLTDPHFDNHQECMQYRVRLEQKCREKGLKEVNAPYLLQNYGPLAMSLIEDIADDMDMSAEEQLIWNELKFCHNNELIVSPCDYLIRRSGRLYFIPDSINMAEYLTLRYFSELLGVDEAFIDSEKKKWDEIMKGSGSQ